MKIHTLCTELRDKTYIKICISRGLKVGKDVIFIEAPKFGSEPYLIEIGDRTKITANCTFINFDIDDLSEAMKIFLTDENLQVI